MAILSIQSHVAFGHVGNSAAVFSLQRLGHDVWPVHTVQFSNHPGHEGFRGEVEASDRVWTILQGIEERGAWGKCQAVLSGYLGYPETGLAVLGAVEAIKGENPKAIYLCDPVIGDTDEGVYVDPAVLDFIRERMVPKADFLSPNIFELATLTGRDIGSADDVISASKELLEMGAKGVIVSSISDGPEDRNIRTMIVMDGKVASVETPKIPFTAKGAGDLLAALWLGRYLQSEDEVEALELAQSSLFALIEKTDNGALSEIPLIREQDLIVNPARRFAAS